MEDTKVEKPDALMAPVVIVENTADEKAVGEIFITASGIDLPPDPDAHLSPEEKAAIDRKLVTKLDMHLIPWLCLLYLMSFLDRTNIGNAKIAVPSLTTTLGHMTTGQYNAALSIFFVSYALFEPLCNVLLKRLRPSIFLPIIMMLWGLCMLSMGFVKNAHGLMAARWFLGMCEAGLYPGVSYLLSCWYKRDEFGIRIAIFFSFAAVSGSFGGLLAAAITNLNGKGGHPGWAWIFIIEGAITILFGALSFVAVHDFPDTATFLSEQDRTRVIRRLKLDKQSSAEHEAFKLDSLWAALTDWKMYLGMVIFMGVDMPLYAFSLFLPTIIAELGYASTKAQLLTVPVYACAAVVTITVGFLADRYKQRGIFNICFSLIGVVGFIMQIASDNPHVKYAATFLGSFGIYPAVANTTSWMANNTEGVYKRGIVLGFVVGWGNLNGVISSNIYFQKPKYTAGHANVLAFMLVFLCGGSCLMTFLLRRENAARLAGKRDHLVQGLSKQEAESLGDKRPDFLYVI